jgi:hypothetical protein
MTLSTAFFAATMESQQPLFGEKKAEVHPLFFHLLTSLKSRVVEYVTAGVLTAFVLVISQVSNDVTPLPLSFHWLFLSSSPSKLRSIW